MRAFAVLLAVTGAVACTPPSGAPAADAGVLDANRTEATDADAPETRAPVDAAAPLDAAAPRRSCGELAPDEKRALEECGYSEVRQRLGKHGAFTVRVEVSGGGASRVRTDVHGDPGFSASLPGSECARAGVLLAPLAPCTWDVRGPFPSWTIRVVESD